ncbi:MAG: hypothetical protein J6P02_05500 [Lachnospiraceae bacterium]|nr:hypothetical protein [Lachnospiraceae bacterium]
MTSLISVIAPLSIVTPLSVVPFVIGNLIKIIFAIYIGEKCKSSLNKCGLV